MLARNRTGQGGNYYNFPISSEAPGAAVTPFTLNPALSRVALSARQDTVANMSKATAANDK